VHRHAEAPLVALLGLVHLGVAPALLVLRRARRGNVGGVRHRTPAHEQTALGKVRVDLLRDRCRQVVLPQQRAESQQRHGVGHVLPTQLDADDLGASAVSKQRTPRSTIRCSSSTAQPTGAMPISSP